MRILALSAGAGAGHNRAAEALAATARVEFPDVRCEWVDSLTYTNRVFRALYGDSYVWMVNHSPALWGMLYQAMGKKTPRPGLERMVKTYDRLAYRKLKRRIDTFKPDAVICTHFLPANVVLARVRPTPPLVFVVVTDFDVHSAWVNPGVTAYFVASEEIRHRVAGYGFPIERVHVTGIPILPQFSTRRGREVVLRELGLVPKAPVVLMISGGVGMANLEEAVARVLAIPEAMHLLVVCGKNEKMRRRLTDLAKPAGDRARIYGFVTNVHDFMEAADVVITKSGGLTVSEALSRGTPMIIVSPIPGQEERNAEYLLERGAAVKAAALEALDFKLRELLSAPERLVRMRQAAESIARPTAARDVIRVAMEAVGARMVGR